MTAQSHGLRDLALAIGARYCCLFARLLTFRRDVDACHFFGHGLGDREKAQQEYRRGGGDGGGPRLIISGRF